MKFNETYDTSMAFGDSMEPTSYLFLYRRRNVEFPVPQHHTFPLFEPMAKSTKNKFKICRRYALAKLCTGHKHLHQLVAVVLLVLFRMSQNRIPC